MSDRTATASSVERYGFLHDAAGRRVRGRRIAQALVDFGRIDLAAADVLDIGCSAGLIADEIASRARFVVGIDVDIDSLAHAVRSTGRPRFVAASGEHLPFRDERFDAVVCNHVYEHVADASLLVREIHRVLRPGGACYFAGGHTLQLIEPHYRLPLLSWLPRPMASAWMRALKRGDAYTEKFVAPWKLGALLRPFSDVRFISTDMLREPGRFGFPGFARWPSAVRRVLLARGVLPRLAPTWIYMLRKS
jgi:2-polyprenyl-3-methyl-5-hydroxy-6-metoxy-1,4-benzoquinol methylase